MVYRFDHSKELEVVGIVVLFSGGLPSRRLSGDTFAEWLVMSPHVMLQAGRKIV
jgi:hypothetical protein